MFATRDLHLGDLIICERPMIMTPIQMSASAKFGADFTREQQVQAVLFEWEKKMRFVFERMPETHHAAYMALANSHKEDGSGPLTGVCRTNGFGVYDFQKANSKGTDEVYTAICKDISRMNHRSEYQSAVHEPH